MPDKLDLAVEAARIAKEAKSKGTLIITYDKDCLDLGAHNLTAEEFFEIISFLLELNPDHQKNK